MTLGTLLSFAGPLLPVSKQRRHSPYSQNCLEQRKCYKGHGSTWNRNRRFPQAAQGRNQHFLEVWWPGECQLGTGKRGVEPANNVTRNTNSPQRGAETLRLVKTRLSSFCATSEKDLGRWPGLVSVGRAVRSRQSPDLYSSTECPRLMTDQVISTEPEVAYQGQSIERSPMLPSHWGPAKTHKPSPGWPARAICRCV